MSRPELKPEAVIRAIVDAHQQRLEAIYWAGENAAAGLDPESAPGVSARQRAVFREELEQVNTVPDAVAVAKARYDVHAHAWAVRLLSTEGDLSRLIASARSFLKTRAE
jgi:hypothetical protein